MQIKIDYMKEEDLNQVMKIEEKAFPSPWSRESFLRDINKNLYAIYLTAKIDKKLIGYIGSWLLIDELHIITLAVDSDYRKKGIASRLLTEIMNLFKKDQLDSVTLEVRKSNKAALNLYQKFGFKRVGKRPHYYSNDGEDALIMRKELGNNATEKS